MPPKRKAQVSVVELQQEHSQDQESTNKRARGANGSEQQQQQLQQKDRGLNVNCKQSTNLPPPSQSDDPIITQFKPVKGQRELNDENIKRIDPESGETILHNYCCYINTTPLAVYRYLIETKGCDVNARDKSNDTAVHHALDRFDPSRGGNITVLMYFLTQTNININIKHWNGETLLHKACNNINALPLEIFRYLIKTKGCDINAKSSKTTPIHHVLAHFDPHKGGNISVLYYFLSRKDVNVNIKDYYGRSLLHMVSGNINKLPLDVFKLLIETHGFDVNAQATNKNTPLHNALRDFEPNKGGDITVLIYLLSQKGINVNIVGEYGRTIFDWACTYINKLPIEIFKLLIETKGCDVNVRDKYNNTPLYDALRYFNPSQGGDIKTLTYLLNQKGVNGNIVGEYGCTLLHYACKRINELPIEIFKLLIETMGCDVNAENKNKDTPLHNALLCFDPSHGGNITVLTYLLNQNYVNLNIKNERGCTLLHVACNNIRDLSFDIFKVLIETMGCDVNAQDNDKDTPLHYALRYFNPNHDDHLVPVLQYLFSQKNADVNIKGKNGHTILHLASICEIGYDDEDDHEDDHDNDDDDEDDDDSDEGLDDSVIEDIQNQKADTTLCQIVEAIAERCIREVFDEEIPLEATTTM